MKRFTKKPSMEELKKAIKDAIDESNFYTEDDGTIEFMVVADINGYTNEYSSYYSMWAFNQFLFEIWKKNDKLCNLEKFKVIQGKSLEEIAKYVLDNEYERDEYEVNENIELDDDRVQNALYEFLEFDRIRDDEIPEEAIDEIAEQIMQDIEDEQDIEYIEIRPYR